MYSAAWLLAACLVLCAPQHARTRRRAPELREDEPARRNIRPAECTFGKQAKELGSTWFADLGPPFGVMYCIKCECISVQKKRRVIAKVQCRNIKNECPEPTCDSPVLLPGRCCKVCPGDITAPDVLVQDSPAAIVTVTEEEELSMKHFGALLTGRTSVWVRRDDMSPVEVGHGAAAGRFTFRRRHLFWSIMLSDAIKLKPRALLFLDRDGRVLVEQAIKRSPGFHSDYEEATGKVCGVWRRVPREYRRALREGSLHAALIWGKEGVMDYALAGRIDRYVGLGSEMFSSLLEPENDENGAWGGTAAITVNAGAAPSIHVAVMFNGIFAPHELRNATVQIIVMSLDRNATIIDEVQTIQKPAHDINTVEVSLPVSTPELRWVSRGRVSVRIRGSGGAAQGIVKQRASCDVFQAPLIGEPRAAGAAWMYLDQEGSLVYNIQVEDHVTVLPKITLVDDYGKRHSQIDILDNLIGTLSRPSPRMFGPLYQEQLSILVSSDNGARWVRGRLTPRAVPDSSGPTPLLMRRPPAVVATTADLDAIAWVSLDNLCTLNYEITVGGTSIDKSDTGLEAYLTSHDPNMVGGSITSGRLLGDIEGVMCEGSVLEPDVAELARLASGTSVLQIRDVKRNEVVLYTEIPQINAGCLPARWDPDNEVSAASPASCFHQKRLYDDGTQWLNSETCSMCGCVHGKVRCDPVRCPPVACSTPSINIPGECCPICTNSTVPINTTDPNRGCYLAGQFHPAGSSWHPYLVPDGYDTCAVCTCDYNSLSVRCPKMQCPPLKCSDREARRPDKRSCCRECPPGKNSTIEDGAPKDQGAPKSAEEILAEGGCRFPDGPLPNGKEVHPNIHSHGEHKCVTCRCKDGVVTCSRIRCQRGACSKRRRPDPCCACKRRHRQRHTTSSTTISPSASAG